VMAVLGARVKHGVVRVGKAVARHEAAGCSPVSRRGRWKSMRLLAVAHPVLSPQRVACRSQAYQYRLGMCAYVLKEPQHISCESRQDPSFLRGPTKMERPVSFALDAAASRPTRSIMEA
jgi:hypothetical protein